MNTHLLSWKLAAGAFAVAWIAHILGNSAVSALACCIFAACIVVHFRRFRADVVDTRVRELLVQLGLKTGPSMKGVDPKHWRLVRRIYATWPATTARMSLATQEVRAGKQFLPAKNGRGLLGKWEQIEVKYSQPPIIVECNSLSTGLEIVAQCRPGIDPARFDRPEVWAAAWGVRECDVRVRGGDRMGITARTAPDATRQTWRYTDRMMPGPERVPIAVDRDSNVVGADLLEASLLIGGLPGSGKSGALSAILAGLSRVPNVALFGLDPKMVELLPWAPRFTRIATEDDDMTDLLQFVVQEMSGRYEWLASRGLKKIDPRHLPEKPLIVVVADELAEVVGSGVTKEEKAGDAQRATLLRRLIQKGRAAGVVVIAATQKPDSTTVPTALRDLFTQRIALRTSARAMTEVIMGGWADLAPAQKLAGRGAAWFMSEGLSVPVLVKCFWVPDEECAPRAAATAGLRVEMPPHSPGRPIAAENGSEESGQGGRRPRVAAQSGLDVARVAQE